jgi:hypothetical protein
MRRRFLFETLAAWLLAAGLFVFGWLMAMTILGQTAWYLGMDQIYVTTSPWDGPLFQASIAASFALPPVFAWLALLVRRLRTRAEPAPAEAVLYLSMLTVAVGVGYALRLLWLRSAFEGNDGGLAPMISMNGLGLPDWALKLGITGGLVLCALAAARRQPAAI